MKGKCITVRQRNGETIKATVIYAQTDTLCVRKADGYIVDVEREASDDGTHLALYGD